MGIAGRRESVREAVKNGFSASGKKASKLEVVGPVETKLKRARCFGMSLRKPLIRKVMGTERMRPTYSSSCDRSRDSVAS